jgi:hypothetical protein
MQIRIYGDYWNVYAPDAPSSFGLACDDCRNDEIEGENIARDRFAPDGSELQDCLADVPAS